MMMKLPGAHQDEPSASCRLQHLPGDRGVDSHVEHARHAQFAARPLSLVPLQPGVHRILELADDGDRPFGTGQVSLFVPVYGLFTSSVEPGSVRGKQGRDRRW